MQPLQAMPPGDGGRPSQLCPLSPLLPPGRRCLGKVCLRQGQGSGSWGSPGQPTRQQKVEGRWTWTPPTATLHHQEAVSQVGSPQHCFFITADTYI